MAGINKVSHGHDDVYEAVGGTVLGGAVVIPQAGATNPGKQGINTAGANSALVLGVAARLAIPVASANTSGQNNGEGYPYAYADPVNELTTVYKQAVVPVVYTAAEVGFGQKLASAANGKVQAWANTLTADTIIGECRVVGGMNSAGGVGLAYIY